VHIASIMSTRYNPHVRNRMGGAGYIGIGRTRYNLGWTDVERGDDQVRKKSGQGSQWEEEGHSQAKG
jgi:hypothetical protein